MTLNPAKETPQRVLLTERFLGIDIFRFVAFVGVVCIHTSSMSSFGYWGAAFGRFAVPFFFVTAGFFIPPRMSTAGAIWKIARRLLPIYIFWVLAFILVYQDWPDSPVELAKRFVSGGQGYHLWFLPSLGLCVAVTVLLRKLGWPATLIISLALYVIGLGLGSYNDLWGAEQTIWNPRNGILMGLIFVSIGAFIRACNISVPLKVSAAAFILFTVMHLIEMSLPMQAGDLYNDFFVLTLPVGVSAFLAALVWRPTGTVAEAFGALGKISLGLYAVHVIFLRLLLEIFSPAGVVGWAATVLAVIALSIGTAWLMSRVPYLRRVVS